MTTVRDARRFSSLTVRAAVLAAALSMGCAVAGRGPGEDGGGSGDAAPVDAAVPADGQVQFDVDPLHDGQVQWDAQVQQDSQVGPDASGCQGGCNTPPNQCYVSTGQCVGTTCVYPYQPSGTNCTDTDPCTGNEQCDGQGNCVGDWVDCSPPHTHGGTCSGGACVGITCDSGWGDCDYDLEGNGCETSLTTTSDCGSCNASCTAGANATASCSSGTCQRSCTGNYENCDGSWSNGCEIPTGVANVCDAGGLNSSTGCWTAYCGQSSDAYAWNQSGNWYCYECTTCDANGSQCRWCNHDTGTWYAWDTCACGSYLDTVCTP